MAHTRRGFLRTMAVGSVLPLTRSGGLDARVQAQGAATSIEDIFARSVIVDDLGGFRPDPKLPNHGWDLLKASGLTICTAGGDRSCRTR
jgi:hypothetical protein